MTLISVIGGFYLANEEIKLLTRTTLQSAEQLELLRQSVDYQGRQIEQGETQIQQKKAEIEQGEKALSQRVSEYVATNKPKVVVQSVDCSKDGDKWNFYATITNNGVGTADNVTLLISARADIPNSLVTHDTTILGSIQSKASTVRIYNQVLGPDLLFIVGVKLNWTWPDFPVPYSDSSFAYYSVTTKNDACLHYREPPNSARDFLRKK